MTISIDTVQLAAVGRLCAWNPCSLRQVDARVAQDILAVLCLAGDSRRSPVDLGFAAEIERIRRPWRGARLRAEV